MPDHPKLVNCSVKDIARACNKLGGFLVVSAGKHVIKITHVVTQKATVIPSAKPLKRGLVWDFVRTFLQNVCGFSEEEIFAVLWC